MYLSDEDKKAIHNIVALVIVGITLVVMAAIAGAVPLLAGWTFLQRVAGIVLARHILGAVGTGKSPFKE